MPIPSSFPVSSLPPFGSGGDGRAIALFLVRLLPLAVAGWVHPISDRSSSILRARRGRWFHGRAYCVVHTQRRSAGFRWDRATHLDAGSKPIRSVHAHNRSLQRRRARNRERRGGRPPPIIPTRPDASNGGGINGLGYQAFPSDTGAWNRGKQSPGEVLLPDHPWSGGGIDPSGFPSVGNNPERRGTTSRLQGHSRGAQGSRNRHSAGTGLVSGIYPRLVSE